MTLTVRFRPTTMPSAMVEVMRSALLSSSSILFIPEPTVLVTSLDASAVELGLSFRVEDMAATGKAKSEIFDLIYRHAKAAGLILSPPPEAVGAGSAAAKVGGCGGPPPQHAAAPARRHRPVRLPDRGREGGPCRDHDPPHLPQRRDDGRTGNGADVADDRPQRRRHVTRQEHGSETELRRLAPGDFFGEGGLLTGEGEPGTIRALTLVVVYEITQEGLAPLMQDRPAIAEELGALLARRTATERYRLEQGLGHAAIASAPSLVARIRHLFEL